jgi:hypothetical protein
MDQRKVNGKPHNHNRSNFAGGERGAATNSSFQLKLSKQKEKENTMND